MRRWIALALGLVAFVAAPDRARARMPDDLVVFAVGARLTQVSGASFVADVDGSCDLSFGPWGGVVGFTGSLGSTVDGRPAATSIEALGERRIVAWPLGDEARLAVVARLGGAAGIDTGAAAIASAAALVDLVAEGDGRWDVSFVGRLGVETRLTVPLTATYASTAGFLPRGSAMWSTGIVAGVGF